MTLLIVTAVKNKGKFIMPEIKVRQRFELLQDSLASQQVQGY